MRVFVTGATGVLGRRLVERLVDSGHVVVGLVRDGSGADLVAECGGTPSRGDVLEPDTLDGAMDDVDVAIHAATYFRVGTKPTDADWARNDRVRLEGARNLVDAANSDLQAFLFPSIVWVARQPDGSRFDEEAQRHPDRATRSAAQVEDYLAEAGAERGFDVTILRCGFFYAPDAGHTRAFGRQLLDRDLPIVGGGILGRRDAELSLLHVDDAARAFVEVVEHGSTDGQTQSGAAIGADATGLYHVVDDEPVTLAAFLSTFAERLHAPEPRRVPGWLARFLVGEELVATLTSPMPTTNERFRNVVGWEPAYPTYREGIAQVVETWRADGTIEATADGYEWAGD